MSNSFYSFFINNLPLYKVPNLFSWQHVVFMLIAALYATGLSFVLKKRTRRTQDIVFKVLSVSCIIVFSGRIFWGYDSIFNPPNPDGFTFKTLLPLELCNLGIFVLIFASFTKNRLIYNLAYFVTLTGGICAFICFPYSHQWPKSDILNFQFFDYYFIHNQLVALPVAMIACGHFKPSLSYVKKSMLALGITAVILFIISLILNALPLNISANYMWTMHSDGIPLLKQLRELIPVPFIYLLPLVPFIFLLLCAMALPFCKKGERLNEFIALFKIRKTPPVNTGGEKLSGT